VAVLLRQSYCDNERGYKMITSVRAKRRKTKKVMVGDVQIGSGSHIVLQSMTKVPTSDISRCVRQIKQLVRAGCELVRIAVPRKADTKAFARIVQKVNVPLIADVHFSAERAIEAIEAGAAKIRLNPGNITRSEDIRRIIDSAAMSSCATGKTAIRIGINEASIRDLRKPDVPEAKRVSLMLKEMKRYVRLFEAENFNQIVLSAKSSNPLRNIDVNRKISESFDYPIHIGLTHAGLPKDVQIPSAVSIGTLLSEGIGDTIRVSAAGSPVTETKIAKQILESLGLRGRTQPELTVCPVCGRAQMDVIKLARQIKTEIRNIEKPVRIAVMGCIVNGPGEAADADLAVCAATTKAHIYRNGRKILIVPKRKIIPALLQELENYDFHK